MVRPARSADGTFLDFLGIVAWVSDMPDEPEDGTPGPGEGTEAVRTDPMRPARAGSIPTTGCGDTPVRWPAPAPPGPPVPAQPPPQHHYRNAVMVLVGVGAVVAVVAWVIVLLSPASDHPLATLHAGHGGRADR